MTFAHFQGGTRVHSDVPRVTFFTEILKIVHGNRSSKTTRFPEGLVLGNWAKTFHPRKIRVAKFMNIFVNTSRRCSIIFRRFADFLTLCEIIAELESHCKSIFCFRMTGIRRIQESWSCEIQEAWGTSFHMKILKLSSGILMGDDFREWGFKGQRKTKSKTSPWKSGSRCELVAGF
jgi:hypothetical protein